MKIIIEEIVSNNNVNVEDNSIIHIVHIEEFESVSNHSQLNLDDGTNPHGTTKQDVGLGSVPNLDTTEAINQAHTHSNKSVLDATEESFTTTLKNAYNSAVNWISTNGTNLLNHLTNTSNPHNVTKSQVGLGNVDDTSDADKPISTATQNALDLKADLVGGKVPASQLPSYVDDVLEFANLATFPVTGESGKIYVDLSTNLQYRWSGTLYISFSSKEKVIFYNRSTWTFPNVASAPFPLISSSNFEGTTANLNSSTSDALTAINSTSASMPIGVAPFNMKLKRVILEGRQTFNSWQGYDIRCVIGSNRTIQTNSSFYSNLDSQVIEDFSHSLAVPVANVTNLFVNYPSSSSVVVPQNHGVVLFLGYNRPNIAVSPQISTYIEFERE
jgi:hypothetical protein